MNGDDLELPRLHLWMRGMGGCNEQRLGRNAPRYLAEDENYIRRSLSSQRIKQRTGGLESIW